MKYDSNRRPCPIMCAETGPHRHPAPEPESWLVTIAPFLTWLVIIAAMLLGALLAGPS